MKINVNARSRLPEQCLRMTEDAVEQVEVNWAAYCDYEGVSLSSVSWAIPCTGVSVGTSTEASNTSKAQVTANRVGRALIQVTGTMSDGQKHIVNLKVVVRDPCDWCVDDYGL